MSKKTTKKPDNTNEDPSPGSSSSNIFKNIFGSIPEHHASLSIFSDNNPFRRKPSESPNQKQQVGSGLGSSENVGNPTNGEDENLTFVEVKTRKRKNEEKKKHKLNGGSIDGTCEILLEIKKLKLGFDSDKEVGSPTNGDDDNVIDSKKRKKKNKEKRKYSLDSGSLDETSEGQLEIKKYKMGEPKSHTFGIESEERGEGKVPNLGMELQALSKQGQGNSEILVMEAKRTDKKKKKRKKDDVETAYEAHHYGVGSNDEGAEGGLGGKVVGKKRKKIEDPVDTMIPKEGFDDEAKLMRTVFVGNLPLKVKKKALLKEFSQFGDVESVRIRSVPLLDTKTPRKGAIILKKINDAVDSVNAYVVFKTEQVAQASLAHNMSVVGGNHIRVDMACPPRKKLKGENAPLYDNKRTVFVGNLPFDVKDEEVYQFFSGITELESSIEAIRVIRDPATSMGKGIAYILFKTRGAANLVVKKRSLKLRDRQLRLSHANSNISPSKRKNHSSGGTYDFSASSKKLAVDFSAPNSRNKVNTKASTSYQGLRASKSGVQKKVHRKNIVEAVKFHSRTQKGEKRVEGKRKRPAVAARRANVLQGGASKQTRKNARN